MFRLPLTPAAGHRHAVLVRTLADLRTRLPVDVAAPRPVGVMTDGETPFTAERRLPGVPVTALTSIAAGQLAGVVAALAAVPAREARAWGVPGDGELLVHGPLTLAALLGDPARGVLTGITGWRLRLGGPDDALDAPLTGLLA